MAKRIKLRAHHLEGVRTVHRMTREKVIIFLIDKGYINNPKDPFVEVSYDNIQKLFQNPSQQFLIVADTLDFICEACPRLRDNKCSPFPTMENPYVGNAFLGGDSDDVLSAEQYNFDLNMMYTSRQIREKMNF